MVKVEHTLNLWIAVAVVGKYNCTVAVGPGTGGCVYDMVLV